MLPDESHRAWRKVAEAVRTHGNQAEIRHGCWWRWEIRIVNRVRHLGSCNPISKGRLRVLRVWNVDAVDEESLEEGCEPSKTSVENGIEGRIYHVKLGV